MDEGSLPAHPQGWCSRYRWCNGGRVRQNLEANLSDLVERIARYLCALRPALRPTLHDFMRTLFGVARWKWRALDAMRIGPKFSTTPFEASNGAKISSPLASFGSAPT
jgi:hypothetical protein